MIRLYKYFLIIFFIFFNVVFLNASSSKYIIELPNLKFDAIEKELLINTELPNSLENNLKYWFNNKVKVDGFDGKVIFNIKSFSEIISNQEDGKNVDSFIEIEFSLIKSDLRKIVHKIKLSSFGSISGRFSIKEFEEITVQSQLDLIMRLSKYFQSNF